MPQSSVLPQPSLTNPQFQPCCAQLTGAHASMPGPGVPHTPGVPPPPHVAGAVQVPQSMMLPQPSPCTSQSKPICAHVSGQQPQPPPHLFALHVCEPGHVPQLMALPHPSPAKPHWKPSWAQVCGTHGPQTLGLLVPQTWPTGQVPHWSKHPHPSAAGPQSKPCCAQVFGMHSPKPQTLGFPLAPHTSPPQPASLPGHVPQSRSAPHVSLAMPQLKPCCAQDCGTHASTPASPLDELEPLETLLLLPLLETLLLLLLEAAVESPAELAELDEVPAVEPPEFDWTPITTVPRQATIGTAMPTRTESKGTSLMMRRAYPRHGGATTRITGPPPTFTSDARKTSPSRT
jgi:hypothetical protein